MSIASFKTIYDPVHGYIKIPSSYCEKIVDTRLFQRLRNIDQTSMKSLYPSGKHDRFTHSLGVYHLSYLSVENILKNSDFSEFEFDEIIKISESIKIACLLHDVGHSPFSHTLEHFYSIHNKGKLEEYLTDIFKSGSFKQDIKDISPAPHELVSAYLSVTCFSQQIEELNGDKEFITRAIIGCKYKSKDGSLPKILKLKNAFMEILSSKIDVDKLDYILRDTWASGAHNTTIDIERLLGSLKIVPYKNTYRLVFKANALSVIGSVIEGRNYLYRFIYNHHKVLYEAEIINRAVLKLSENISKGEKETFLSQIFNINVFFKKTLYKAITLFYPNDADFTYFLKADEDNNPYANEFLARNHKRFPLWKTFAHFKVLYAHKKKYELANIVEERDKIINSFTKKHGLKRDDIIVLKASPKTSHIMNDDVLVEIGGKICELTELYPSENENKSYDMDCPFVYLSRDKAHLKEELIKFIDEYI